MRKMSFDPMAIAIDWLDAYRAGNIEAILEMYAEDAVVHCGCCAAASKPLPAARHFVPIGSIASESIRQAIWTISIPRTTTEPLSPTSPNGCHECAFCV